MATTTPEDLGDLLHEESEDEELELPAGIVALESDDTEEEEEPEAQEPSSPFSGDEFDEDLRGKTPQEIDRVFRELKTASRMLAQQLQASPAPQTPTPAPPAEPEEAPTITFDDLTDDGKLNQKLEKFFQVKAQPALKELQQLRASQAQTRAMQAYTSAMNDDRLPYLRKYKSEVDTIVSRMPAENVTSEAMVMIHNHVVANHLGEVMEDHRRAEQRAPVTELPKGKSAAPTQKAKLTPEQKRVAKMLGVSEKEYSKMVPLTYQGG